MMDCKKALVEADGDKEKAAEWLRVKGLASAGKKEGRATKEGLVETYVHTGGKLGVMVEVNCETDFVSKGDKFKELTKMLAMQIAACPARPPRGATPNRRDDAAAGRATRRRARVAAAV